MPRTDSQPDRGHDVRGATPTQLLAAERGLRQALAKTYSASWIAQNAGDLLNEANKEYAEWLLTHRPAYNPPGWLIHCARLRATNLLIRETRRAGPPLDSVAFVLEDRDPGPEQAALDTDRKHRIEAALAELPEKDRRLLALVHDEDHSISAAGRLLGWGKSSANRHYADALDTLERLLGPRELLSLPFVGLVAQKMGPGRLVGGFANRVSAIAQDVADIPGRMFGAASRNAGEAVRRLTPWTETTGAAGSAGGGRFAAQCGTVALAVVCSAAAIAPIEHRNVFGIFSESVTEQSARPVERPTGPRPAESTPREPAAGVQAGAGRPARPAELAAARRAREKRRRRRAKRRRARKIAKARRARKARRRRAGEAEARRHAAPEEEAAAPIEEAAPVEEAAPTDAGPPPAATGEQVRREVGH